MDDLEWIMEQVRTFAIFYGCKKNLIEDESYARTGLSGVIRDGVILIAESNNTRMGFIAGMMVAHPYNPNIRMLCEMFWWVPEKFRHTRAGYLLLKEYIKIGKEKADWIMMCSVVNSPINENALERHGFRLQERSYLMEV